jgi:hypothetical protein
MVVGLNLSISYPDDSHGVASFDAQWIEQTAALFFLEESMTEGDRRIFRTGSIWQRRPALIRRRVDGGSEGVCALRGHESFVVVLQSTFDLEPGCGLNPAGRMIWA